MRPASTSRNPRSNYSSNNPLTNRMESMPVTFPVNTQFICWIGSSESTGSRPATSRSHIRRDSIPGTISTMSQPIFRYKDSNVVMANIPNENNDNLPTENELLFEFDKVFGPKSDTTELYRETIQEGFRSAFFGTPACVLTLGPLKDMRKEILIGKGELKRGVLQMGIEDILKWNLDILETDKITLRFSAVLIYCSRIIDLLRATTEDVNYKKLASDSPKSGSPQKQQELIEIDIRDEFDLKKLLKIIQKEIMRAEPELGATQLEDCSHIIYTVRLYRKNMSGKLESFSQIDLVKLTGSEYANSGSKTSPMRQFAVNSLNSLSSEILLAALCRPKKSSQSSLTSLLNHTLNQYSKILFVTCVDDNINSLEMSLPALKFSSRIRECIFQKQMQKSSIMALSSQRNNKSELLSLEKIPMMASEEPREQNDFINKQTELDLDTKRTNEWLDKKASEINALMGTIKMCLEDQNEETNLLLQKKHAELLEAKKDLARVKEVVNASSAKKGKENGSLGILGTKIERLQASVEKYDKDIAGVITRIESLEKNIVDTKMSEKQKLEEEISILKERNVVLENEIKEKEGIMKEAEDQILQMKTENEKITADFNDELKNKENEHVEAIQKVEAELQNVQDQLKLTEVKLTERLKNEQDEFEKYRNNAQSEIEGQKQEIENLKQQNAENEKKWAMKYESLQADYAKYQQSSLENLKKIKLQLESEQENSEKLRYDLKISKQELTGTKEDLEILRTDLNKKILAERDKNVEYEEKLRNNEQNLIKSNEENEIIKEHLTELKGRIVELETNLEENQKNKETLEKKLAETQADMENLQKDNTKNKDQIKNLQDEIDEKVKQMSTIQKELNETVQAKEQQSVEYQGIIQEKHGAVKNEQEKYEKIVKENEKLKSDNMYLMNKTSQQKEEIEQLKSQVEQSTLVNEKELSEIETKYEAITGEMKRLLSTQNEHVEKEKKYKKLTEEMEQKFKEVVEKCEKMKKQKSKYKNKLENAEKRIKELEFELALEVKTARSQIYAEPRKYDLENIRDKIRSIKSQKNYKP